jgi:hypothetical protein
MQYLPPRLHEVFFGCVMTYSRRQWLQIAWAQSYPARSVRIVVGFSAGGTTDIAARLIARALSELLGQQFIVENEPGAATNIATEAVVRAPADGYTLIAAAVTNTINAALCENMSFNFIRRPLSAARAWSRPSITCSGWTATGSPSTPTPKRTSRLVRNVLLAVMSSLANVDAEKISERVKAGLQRVVAKGKTLGRPRIDPTVERNARKMLAAGVGMLKVASALDIGPGTVQRNARGMGN